jgi:hypothetical protein
MSFFSRRPLAANLYLVKALALSTLLFAILSLSAPAVLAQYNVAYSSSNTTGISGDAGQL